MPSETAMKAVLRRYVDAVNGADIETLIALFAPDATVEDPFGTPARAGIEQIRGFYAGAMAAGVRMEVVGPFRASRGDAAAFAFRVHLPGRLISVIDVMTFDKETRIVSMKAYYGETDAEPAD